MSLNWNAQKVADYKALHEDKVEWAIMTFLQRLRVYCAATDNDLDTVTFVDSPKDMTFTKRRIEAADIARRIGLTTNVSPITDAKFSSEVRRWMKQRHSDQLAYLNRARKDKV